MKSIIVGSIFIVVAYAARIAERAPVIHEKMEQRIRTKASSFDPGALANKYTETINNWQTIAMLEHKSEACEKGLEELGTQLVGDAVERATALRAACQNWNSVECNKKQEALYEFEEKQKAKCEARGHSCHYTMETSHGEEKINTCMPKACHQDILAENARKPMFTKIQCGDSLTAPQTSLLQKMEQERNADVHEFNPVKAAPSMPGVKGVAKVASPSRNQVALKATGGTGVAEVDNVGILPPVGFFDPAGLSEGASEDKIRRWREIELKHGRQSMLAATGFVVGEQFHPLFPDIDGPSALVWQEEALRPVWAAIIAAIAALELGGASAVAQGKRPGDFGFDPLGLKPEDPDALDDKQTRELQNGRLAMLGIAGMVAQEIVDTQKIQNPFDLLR